MCVCKCLVYACVIVCLCSFVYKESGPDLCVYVCICICCYGVVPDLFHIVPVGHDAVLDRVAEGEDVAVGMGFTANVKRL